MPSPLTASAFTRLPGIAHGFFTRQGGVSSGIYATLNCGSGSHDDAAAVRENRGRVIEHLGARHLLSAHQVHGTTAITVSSPWPLNERPKADGMVTATPGIALGVLTADCAPLLFADPDGRVVGAAHAGWRGALAGIAEATITAMEGLGARRERIVAAVGPCIGVDAYEVGPEFEAEFIQHDASTTRFFQRTGAGSRPHFDLAAYIAHRLREARLADVAVVGGCTYARSEDFFSYRRSQARREPDYGRQISAIVLT
jgi:polyphenol oxidase